MIKDNKKHKIKEHDDVLDDNNNTASIITKANRNNMLKSNPNKKKDKVYDKTNIDEELMKRDFFKYNLYIYT